MSKEELLISLLKSEQSIAELRKSKSSSIGIEEIKKKFNVLRNDFSKEKIKEIIKNFIKKKRSTNALLNKKKKTKQNKKNERKNITPEN